MDFYGRKKNILIAKNMIELDLHSFLEHVEGHQNRNKFGLKYLFFLL